ncbi:LysM domain-containing protein [Demequina sp. NBRC 110057]|uniref:LysM peptidoglycan-binding domain-containing protein n=1 Tax=Demequina sp. NBRC 110057 TaxID=1570346 RepID=UPI00190EE5FD|nr:LysM domain-containing protein [Demequina sp. NBRC 110057]
MSHVRLASASAKNPAQSPSPAPSLGTRLGAVAALVGLPTLAAVLVWVAWADGAAPLEIDALVVRAVAAIGALACAWLALSAAALALAPAPVRRRLERHSPAILRRLVAIAIGASAAAGVALPAAATAGSGAGWVDPPPATSDVASTQGPAVASAGWVPRTTAASGTFADSRRAQVLAGAVVGTRDAGTSATPSESGGAPRAASPQAVAPHATPPTTAAPQTVTVRSGDNLWELTATALGTQDAAVIAASWPLLYEDNREAIGDDPSLIRPGTTLTLPPEWSR